MKNLILFLLAIFTIFSCSSRDNDDQNNSIIGVWNNPNEEVYNLTFTKEGRFYTKVKGGKGINEEDNGTYKYDGSILKTKFIDKYQNGNPIYAEDVSSCKIEGNKMTLEGSLVYTRQ